MNIFEGRPLSLFCMCGTVDYYLLPNDNVNINVWHGDGGDVYEYGLGWGGAVAAVRGCLLAFVGGVFDGGAGELTEKPGMRIAIKPI